MKHLKLFESFPYTDDELVYREMIQCCKDILLELEDDGINTRIQGNAKRYTWISLFFFREEKFTYSDIESVVERLKSYLSEYGLSVKWMSPDERNENKPTIKTIPVQNPTNLKGQLLPSKTSIPTLVPIIVYKELLILHHINGKQS